MADAFIPVAAGERDFGHISPTDISQFIRLEQCERYLRLRMYEKAVGERFMYEYGVAPQSLPPLLTLSGGEFERLIEEAVAAHFRKINFATEAGDKRDRDNDNQRVVELAHTLPSSDVIIIFQSRLCVELGGWLISGDVDIIRLERDRDGFLHVLIADMKSSTNVKVEHRLQVAFYHAMIARLFEQAAISYSEINTAILYSGPADPDKLISREELAQYEIHRDTAEQLLSVTEGLLEIVGSVFLLV